MLIKQPLPLGDLHPQRRILAGNACDIHVRIPGYRFQSLLLPKLKNVAGKLFAEPHIKDVVYIRSIEGVQEGKGGIQRRLALMEETLGNKPMEAAIDAELVSVREDLPVTDLVDADVPFHRMQHFKKDTALSPRRQLKASLLNAKEPF